MREMDLFTFLVIYIRIFYFTFTCLLNFILGSQDVPYHTVLIIIATKSP